MSLFCGVLTFIILAASFANAQVKPDPTIGITVIGKAKVAVELGGVQKGLVVDCTQSATDCTKSFSIPRGSALTITSTAAPGFFFKGWVNRFGDSSACSDLNPICKFTLTQNTTVAAFYGVPLALSFKGGAPLDRIVATSPNSAFNMACDFNKSCTEVARAGIQIVLKVAPKASVFKGWTGGAGSASACNGQTTDCTFTLTQGSAVQAGLTANPKLIISRAGSGQIRVQSASGFDTTITNLGTAVTQIPNGVTTTVTAQPATGSVFKRWIEATGPAVICKGQTNPVCTFALIGDGSLKAEFSQ